jgi:hypothetical protein
MRRPPHQRLAGRSAPNALVRAVPSGRDVRLPWFGTAVTHLREVLGDQSYESLARRGEAMTTAEMVTYTYDQIDQARAELDAVSK